jgi:hypothetical protein
VKSVGQDTEDKSKKKQKSFWATLPGILTASAALITALATLIGALSGAGLLNEDKSPNEAAEKTPEVTPDTKASEIPSDSIAATSPTRTVDSNTVLTAAPGEEVDLPMPQQRVEVAYVCQDFGDGTFATVAKTSIGDIQLINWSRNISIEYTPESRCVEVTERFESLSNLDSLDYLTTGRINGENVICSAGENGDCNRDLPEQGLVFTITGERPPGEVLLNLLDLGLARDVPPINESAGERLYIDVNNLLQQVGNSGKPIEEATEPASDEPCILGCEN